MFRQEPSYMEIDEKVEIALMKYSKNPSTIALKAHCRDADWINKAIKKKRIKPDSLISLYSEIHEADNDLIPFILETKHDPRA